MRDSPFYLYEYVFVVCPFMKMDGEKKMAGGYLPLRLALYCLLSDYCIIPGFG